MSAYTMCMLMLEMFWQMFGWKGNDWNTRGGK